VGEDSPQVGAEPVTRPRPSPKPAYDADELSAVTGSYPAVVVENYPGLDEALRQVEHRSKRRTRRVGALAGGAGALLMVLELLQPLAAQWMAQRQDAERARMLEQLQRQQAQLDLLVRAQVPPWLRLVDGGTP
jgi:hypothetical protein